LIMPLPSLNQYSMADWGMGLGLHKLASKPLLKYSMQFQDHWIFKMENCT
jgi:hypothetical protein